jgi:hypothetical protein
MGHSLKLPSSTKLAKQYHFPPASQAGRLAGPVVFYTISFLGVNQRDHKAGLKIPTRLNVRKKLTIYDKHLPQSSFTVQFFLDNNILY